MVNRPDGDFLHHAACPDCGSSDGLAVYQKPDGTIDGYCWASCTSKFKRLSEVPEPMDVPSQSPQRDGGLTFENIEQLPSGPLTQRGISAKTAERYGVKVYNRSGADVGYFYPITHKGEVVEYQCRKLPKLFSRKRKAGVTKGHRDLFGQQQAGNGGKLIIITEGQDDCLAAVDLLLSLNKNYRVVGSLGTDGWKQNLEFLERYQSVVIAFDQDDAGKEAANALADALTPGKARIASWQDAKDVNDLLNQNRAKDFLDCINNSSEYSSVDFITGERVWDRMQNYTTPALVSTYPPEFTELNRKLEGLREGEISLLISGTGCGKTSFVRRLKQHILTSTDVIAAEIELEERPERTWRGLMQYQLGKKLHEANPDERRAAFEATYGTGRLITVDHSNQKRGKSLINKMRQLHYGYGVKLIYLDHITLAVNDYGENSNHNIDEMMGEFSDFVAQTGVHLCLVSHLRKTTNPGGKSFESGAVPTEDDIKGSGSVKQLTFDIVAMARNKYHEDEYLRNVTSYHVLKSRETGSTGEADVMHFETTSQLFSPAEIQDSADEYPDSPPINRFGLADAPDMPQF